MPHTRADILPLTLALLIALAARLFAAVSLRFDGLYGQDSFAYYYHGVALWRDHSLLFHWPWLPRSIRLFWPYGEPAQLALAFAIAGGAGTIPALSVSMIAGLGVVVAVYALTLAVAAPLLPPPLPRAFALLSALLLALSGLAVQASCTIMSDAPALFWGSLSIWLWHGAGRRDQDGADRDAPGQPQGTAPRRRQGSDTARSSARAILRAFAAGTCLGLAFVTRYEYALLVAPLSLAWWAHPGGRRPHLAPLLAGVLLVALPQFVTASAESSPLLGHQWVLGWRPGNVWRSTFTSPEGLFRYDSTPGSFYLAGPLLSARSLPPPLAPFAAIGVLSLIRASSGGGLQARKARVSLATLVGWWLVPTLYLSGLPFESSRYTLILLPSLAILEGLGAAATLRWLRALRRGRPPTANRLHSQSPCHSTALACPARSLGIRHPGAVAGPLRKLATQLGILWIGGSLALAAAHSRTPLQTLAGGKAGDLAAARQAVALAPEGAHLATFGLTLSLYHYEDLGRHHLTLVDLSAVDTPTLHALLGSPLVVVVDIRNLATQWAGRAPDRAFRYLDDHGKLDRLRTVGPYTIFRSTPRVGGR